MVIPESGEPMPRRHHTSGTRWIEMFVRQKLQFLKRQCLNTGGRHSLQLMDAPEEIPGTMIILNNISCSR